MLLLRVRSWYSGMRCIYFYALALLKYTDGPIRPPCHRIPIYVHTWNIWVHFALKVALVCLHVTLPLYQRSAYLDERLKFIKYFSGTMRRVRNSQLILSLYLEAKREDRGAYPDSKVHEANMGPTWVLSALGGPHVGPINFAIRVVYRAAHLIMCNFISNLSIVFMQFMGLGPFKVPISD